MNKLEVGFFAFTEITGGRHREYNEWHMLDHMPEQFPIPGIAFGQRWVSTPACRAARLFEDAAFAETHYLTCYYMTAPVEATLTQFYELADKLRALGRFFAHRRGIAGGPHLLVKEYAAARVLVSAESIPYRPNRGIFPIVCDAVPGVDADETGSWLDTLLIPELLRVSGVAGAYSYVARSGKRDSVFSNQSPAGRRIVVLYLDEDPLAVTAALRAVIGRGGRLGAELEKRLRPVFAGPLETIQPWKWDWFD
jgi:hypothetical protein